MEAKLRGKAESVRWVESVADPTAYSTTRLRRSTRSASPSGRSPHVLLFLDRVGVRQDDLPNRHPVMLALDRIARMMPELAERAHDELI